MTITVPQAISDALRLCGQQQAPGRGDAPEEQVEVLRYLNRLLDGWGAMQQLIFTVGINRYPLTLVQNVYTIGPSGANIPAPRPIAIRNANLVLTSSSPEVFIPIRILDDNEFANLPVLDYATNVPTMLYYSKNEMGSENGKIYLIGKPNVANELQLFTDSGFTNTLTSGDSITLPEGYLDAIISTLAVKISPLYWQRTSKMLSELKIEARRARAALIPLNSQAPHQQSDFPGTSGNGKGPYYNYLTGFPA